MKKPKESKIFLRSIIILPEVIDDKFTGKKAILDVEDMWMGSQEIEFSDEDSAHVVAMKIYQQVNSFIPNTYLEDAQTLIMILCYQGLSLYLGRLLEGYKFMSPQ